MTIKTPSHVRTRRKIVRTFDGEAARVVVREEYDSLLGVGFLFADPERRRENVRCGDADFDREVEVFATRGDIRNRFKKLTDMRWRV